MNKKFLIGFFCLFCSIQTQSLFGESQINNLKFEHLTVDDGLSQSWGIASVRMN